MATRGSGGREAIYGRASQAGGCAGEKPPACLSEASLRAAARELYGLPAREV